MDLIFPSALRTVAYKLLCPCHLTIPSPALGKPTPSTKEISSSTLIDYSGLSLQVLRHFLSSSQMIDNTSQTLGVRIDSIVWARVRVDPSRQVSFSVMLCRSLCPGYETYHPTTKIYFFLKTMQYKITAREHYFSFNRAMILP